MASNPSQNLALELMTTGEKSGQWGDITNVNMQIIDRATKGVGTITLTTTSYSLDTDDYTASEGHYAVLVFAGTPGGTCTVTINPNDQQKVFIVRNTTPSSVVLTQGSGGNVTVASGEATIVYATGSGSGSTVVDIASLFGFQASSTTLTDISGLSVTDGNFIVGNGSTWVAESGATARTSLGLGTIATQDSSSVSITGGSVSSVSITGGSVSGITDLAIADGGTGASTASAARTNLGVAIGTDVLAYDSNLQSFVSTFTLPTTDSTNGYVLSTDGAGNLVFAATGTGDGSVTSVAVSGGTTGLTTSGGPITTSGTITLSGTLNVANGGTGATTDSGARTALGLAIGTDVQAYDADLTTIAGLAKTDGNFIVGNGTAWTVESGATARTSLGLAIGTDVLAYDSNLQSFVTAFTLPTSDGTADQVLSTNGSGTLSFSSLDINNLSDGYYDGSSLGLGSGALANDNGTTNQNTAVGKDALTSVTSGSFNTSVGSNSCNSITTGSNNTAIGFNTLDYIASGTGNTAIGSEAGIYARGSSNTFVGHKAGYYASTLFSSEPAATHNTAVGFQALYGLAGSGDGYFNTAVGSQAGATITTGYNNVVIGYNAQASSSTATNEITIGSASQKVVRFPGTTTVSALPSASTVGAGARAFVTDATATTFASVVAGSGSNGVPVYSDGTNWRIG